MKYDVYFAKGAIFRDSTGYRKDGTFFNQTHARDCFRDGYYEKVLEGYEGFDHPARVLEDIFSHCQNQDGNWDTTTQEYVPQPWSDAKHRSMCVGDIIRAENSRRWIVASFGFDQLCSCSEDQLHYVGCDCGANEN